MSPPATLEFVCSKSYILIVGRSSSCSCGEAIVFALALVFRGGNGQRIVAARTLVCTFSVKKGICVTVSSLSPASLAMRPARRMKDE